MKYVDIVFAIEFASGAPRPPEYRFVEAEGPEGRGVRIGSWIERPDGLTALRIPLADPVNGLTKAEEEMLVITGEECGELMQAVSKIWRHGKEGEYRDGTPNLEALEGEAADVMACLAILVKNGFLNRESVNSRARQKLALLREPGNDRIHYITPDMLP